MAAITAAMVGELRAKTDAPMMECKKALSEAEGDMARAEEILRVMGATRTWRGRRYPPRNSRRRWTVSPRARSWSCWTAATPAASDSSGTSSTYQRSGRGCR